MEILWGKFVESKAKKVKENLRMMWASKEGNHGIEFWETIHNLVDLEKKLIHSYIFSSHFCKNEMNNTFPGCLRGLLK